jgi:CheY-like chemotaxis protein
MSDPQGGGGPRLDLLSVLLVEDSKFIRSVVIQTLRAIGFGRIEVASDGVEAIRFIESRKSMLPPGVAPVDLIIADLVMPEIDGLTLLRWVRSSPKSPDKFLPVVILSGAADRNYVQQARDLGATEFMAKPFSAQTVAERLLHVIFRPRRFVLCKGYFGPDRRRSGLWVQHDRRQTTSDAIQVVHSQTRSLTISNDGAQVVYFELPNRLAAKAGGQPGAKELPAIPLEVLAAAEEQIQSNGPDYTAWVTSQIDAIVKVLQRLQQPEQPVARLMSEVNRGAHELRGHGGVFGYPLVTKIAKSLYDATNRSFSKPLTESEHMLYTAHIDAIRAVMRQRIEGDGGEIGQQLLAMLEVAKKKYSGDNGESGDGQVNF